MKKKCLDIYIYIREDLNSFHFINRIRKLHSMVSKWDEMPSNCSAKDCLGPKYLYQHR